MDEQHSISDARSNLPGLIRKAEQGEVVKLTRHGKPVAVLISQRAHERLTAQEQSFAARCEDFRAQHNLENQGINPDEIWGGTRAKDTGRDVQL